METKHSGAAAIAARQHGRITAKQLIECGWQRTEITRAGRDGRLHRLHQGVYALGHLAPSREADWHAAVLACGPDARLSVRCAATAFGIRDGVRPRIDVTIPSDQRRRRPGIEVHRGDLLPFEVDVWRGIPITSPARTLLDLAYELRDRPEEIEWAMREMQFRRLFDVKLAELSNRRRPSATIGRLLRGIEPTRSPLEIAFLRRVVERHGLPTPQVNVRVEGFLVDFFWPEARLIVETDGRQHDEPLQKAADAHRDAIHAGAGYRILRYRWADVAAHHRTAAEVRSLLTQYVSKAS